MATNLDDCQPPVSGFERVDITLVIEDMEFRGDLPAVHLQSDGISTRTVPALSATWTAPTSPYIVGVEFEYTPVVGGGETTRSSPQNPLAAAWKTTSNIVGGAEYSVLYRAVGVNSTYGEWSDPPDLVTIAADAGPYTGTGEPTFPAPPGSTYTDEAGSGSWRYDNAAALQVLTLTNPDFETGDMTGWTVSHASVTAVVSGGDDTPHGGSYMARAGTVTPTNFYQDISVAAHAAVIDTGSTTLVGFAAWHATYNIQDDRGRLEAIFLDNVGAVISQAVTSYTHPNNWTVETLPTAAVPVGTRTIRLGTRNNRWAGTNNDNYWDDFYSPTLTRTGWVLISDAIVVQDEGVEASASLRTLNFVGPGVEAVETSPGVVDVTIGGAGNRCVQVPMSDPNGADLTVGDGKGWWWAPMELDGYIIVDVEGALTTVSSSGAVTVQIRNMGLANDILSTALTIDASEEDSLTAATPRVINATYDTVTGGQWLRFDCDGAGTGAKGLYVTITLQAGP